MLENQLSVDRPIVWGIIGTGEIADHFAEDLHYCRQAELGAVYSRSIEKVDAFASRYSPAASYTSLSLLLADENIDIVYVALPNDLHFETACAALEAGKAVLVEKPLVLNSLQAQELNALAARRGLFLMEAMWTRFLPSFMFAKKEIASGAIGQLRRIECDLAFHHPFKDGSRFYDKARGGGALLDLGCYPISLAIALLGKPDVVSGSWTRASSGVDSSASVHLKFGEAKALLNCAIDRQGANTLTIEGTKGIIVLQPPFIGARIVLQLSTGPFRYLALAKGHSFAARAARYLTRKFPLPGIKRLGFFYPGHGLQFEIEAATSAIANGMKEHPGAPPSDSIETLRVIEAVLNHPPNRD